MQLFWGNNGATVNAAEVRAHYRNTLASNGRPARFATRFDVRMKLYADGQAALTTLENQWKGYLQTPYQDLVLKQDDGTQSSLALINNTSISGVRLVDGPHFPEAKDNEFVNERTIEFAIEGEYKFPGTESLIIELVETISVHGNGGPRFVWQWPVNADGFPQQVSTQSMITTVQRGRIVGHTGYPARPKPFAGKPLGIYVNEEESFENETPEPLGRGYVNYPVSYSYTYRSNKLLKGNPTLPPLAAP